MDDFYESLRVLYFKGLNLYAISLFFFKIYNSGIASPLLVNALLT